MSKNYNVTIKRTEFNDLIVRADSAEDAELLAIGWATLGKGTSVKKTANKIRPWEIVVVSEVKATTRGAVGTVVDYDKFGRVKPALVPDTNSVSGFSKSTDLVDEDGNPTHKQTDRYRVADGLPSLTHSGLTVNEHLATNDAPHHEFEPHSIDTTFCTHCNLTKVSHGNPD